MQQYQNVLQDKFGNVIVGASVAVYVYGTTTPATIYSGNGTGLLPSNTVTTSSLGEFAFYAANGRYSLSITATNFVAESYSDFILYDPADIGAVTASGVAFTPFGTVAATNVQNAIQEVVSDLSASSGSSLVGFLQSGIGAQARTVQAKERDFVSVKDFGAVGDGTTDDTAAVAAALATMTSGGALYFPPGTYRIQRGTGSLLSDNIVGNNVKIFGAGSASKITGYNAANAIANNAGNEYYNVFQATNRSNITVSDLSFEGYTTPVSLFTCDNVSITGIVDSALLANAGGYLRDKSIYLSKCSNVRLSNCKFDNAQFAVYLSGDGTTQSKNITVIGCNFEQSVAAGSFTSLFPVGVYAYYVNDVVVSGNTFRNIYSSLDSGTTGTGMGYGVYEGDGLCNKISITGNTFQYDAKGSKNATGIYINQASQAVIVGNNFRSESSGRLSSAILLDIKISGGERVVSGNSIQILNTSGSWYGVYVSGTSTSTGKIRIASNVFYGGLNAIRVDGLQNVIVDVDGNTISNTNNASIQFNGLTSSTAIKFPKISNNKITASQNNGILLNQYVISAVIIGNSILDGNLSNTAGDSGAAIQFSTFSHGSFIVNNVIGNTPTGGGLFTYGVQNANNVVDRIFKDIIVGNTFLGIGNNNQFGRYVTSSPTNGVFDINKGDFIQNVQLNASGNPGWYCAFVLSPTLTADASSASTTITVSSTSSMVAGQTVLLTKTNNPYSGDYATTANWHVDTIASVTDATHFVLTTGIPAGDGTYVAGTASVKVASFKAAAAIAA